jgi:hypothetical protein
MLPTCICVLLLAFADPAGKSAGTALDLSRAVVLTPAKLAGPEEQAVRMLMDEIARRSFVRWERVREWPAKGVPVVVVGPARGVWDLCEKKIVSLPFVGESKEGFDIGMDTGTGAPVVWVAGNDPRGTLFGVGRLLRELRIERSRVSLPAGFQAREAPRTSLRGHQIGYRPKTNSYDGWTVPMWEQYLRDLAVFGCNAVELIPPRSDDAADSPHFPLPPLRMMTEVSRLADAYGMDVWIWYPAMDRDYTDPKTVDSALREWGEVFRALPRVDAVFVPGGDPGHTPPRVLFAFLEKQAANLRKYHPRAALWVSPQSFSQAWLEDFFTLLRSEPTWLAGVVYGPEIRIDLPEFRKRVPAKYPIRDYPDVTHSRHCQYPVPDWDVAYALTEGREVCNPRPRAMALLARRNLPHTVGFITYSEGCHDDVNKAVWSALAWNEGSDVRDTLRQYARYFIDPAFEERFAEGLLGLENNWTGPILDNAGIDKTLDQFRAMEREARPAVKLNWRFQQALYRAYYDGYIRTRLRYETDLLAAAQEKLRRAKNLGSRAAMDHAEALLDQAEKERPGRDLRQRAGELAEALFQSVRAQLSVPKYQAIGVERGANLDTIDVPLTDAAWWKKHFAAIRQLGDETERRARIEALLNRSDPGPGGFYDDLGDPARSPHLVRGVGWEKDPGFYRTPLTGFSFRGYGPNPATPRAWWHHAEALYDEPLILRYTSLDPQARYRVQVVYGLDRRPSKIRLTANGAVVHDYLAKALQELEFDLPPAATAGDTLSLEWTQPPGQGGTGRGCAVAEVWLLKVNHKNTNDTESTPSKSRQ